MRNERQQAADKSRGGAAQRLSPELSEFLHMLDALEGQLRASTVVEIIAEPRLPGPRLAGAAPKPTSNSLQISASHIAIEHGLDGVVQGIAAGGLGERQIELLADAADLCGIGEKGRQAP